MSRRAAHPISTSTKIAALMKEANLHWKTVSEALLARGLQPVACLEAARSAVQVMHHDEKLAMAFHAALADAKRTAEWQAQQDTKRKMKR